ncbi:MAG: DNA polymerase III subunit alpha [Bacteroidaceae bacterium]|nr:DNA polymerase III subunit alpha [Bacteroidaceae bacterium]
MQDFIHLHVHTYYSILDGQASVKKLVKKAIDNDMRGIAVTDHGDMFGIKELFDECNSVNKGRKKEGKEPFKPIFGCEMYVARRGMKNMNQDKMHPEDRGGYHLIVLAKNYNGYKNLIQLVSDSWVDGFYGRPRTDHEQLEKYHEGLILCSACIAGEVPAKILRGDIEGARKAIEWHKNIWGEDYYLELQRHEVKNPTIRANRETFELQQTANEELIKLAKEYGVKLVCTNDVHFVDEDNAEAHDHLLCLSTGKDLDDPNRMLYSKQEWFKTKEEMNEIFADVPEALSNTTEILDKVEFYDIEHAPIMPFYPIPEDFGTEEQWREKISPEMLFDEFTSDENGENPMPREEGEKKIAKLGGIDKLYRIKFEADYLKLLAMQGAIPLYPQLMELPEYQALGIELPPEAKPTEINAKEVDDRIRFELHIMKTMGFPGYFLIVQDFINSAQKDLDVMVGPGRGSAAGSVVAYCLGITKIDPMKYDLLFERFLNPDRISLPDIDTDFDDDGRGRVLEWVENKYGHANCAHIITYSTMATKNSIKDVARVEKLPLDVTNRLCKEIPDRLPDSLKMNLPNAIKSVEALRNACASADPKMSNTMRYAQMLEGTVRGTGIHACGFIICRDPISNWVPVSVAEDKDNPGHKLRCTQYDGHVIESTGLIKMDFLGLKTLSIMKECLNNVRLTTGEEIDLDNIPIDDELTYKLYQEGRTVGTFQFESAGMQKYLRELHPTVFEDLIAMNALYRPGPMDYIPDFIKRKHDPSLVEYDIPCMEKYLKDTYGITVYQEQVMLLSRQLADFTRGESDALRKAMGKKKKDIVDAMKPKFISGGEKNGHDPKILEKIWTDWEKFASYAFNKSHATCYSWVAYQTAYLKAHYPAEYMSAVMTRSYANISDITKLMDECKAMGINTFGPDINESRQFFTPDSHGNIRFGFAAISGLGTGTADELVREREDNGPYKDIFDVVKRVNLSSVNRKCLEALAYSGGFDSFGLPREQYLVPGFLDTLVRFGQLFQAEKNSAQNSLFGAFEEVDIPNPKFPEYMEMSHIEKLNIERKYIGIYLSAHPLDEFNAVLTSYCNTLCTDIADINKLKTKQENLLGGLITNVRTGYTKKGNVPYGVVVIEDYSGSGEIFLMDKAWTDNAGILTIGSTIFIRGKVEKRNKYNEELTFRPHEIKQLGNVLEEQLKGLTIQIEADNIDEMDIAELISIVERNPGQKDLKMEIKTAGYSKPLKLQSGAKKVFVTQKIIDKINELQTIKCKIDWE